jgi:hypothetical protein
MKRELTEFEKKIIQLCQAKHGSNERDKVFFLESGEAIFQAWGNNGDGPWTHISNLASWLEEGSLSESEIMESQI